MSYLYTVFKKMLPDMCQEVTEEISVALLELARDALQGPFKLLSL